MRKVGAAIAAEKLLQRFGIESPAHIKLEALAHLLGVEVIEGDTFGCVAQLTPIEGRARIRVGRGGHPGRKRFSIAHELGHFVLRHRTRVCSDKDLRDWSSDGGQEKDANIFAATLLMPEPMIRPYVDVDEATFAGVLAMASEFNVSLTAAAIRFVETTALAAAVVLAERGVVKWCVKNDDFWPYLLARGSRLDPFSRAAKASPGADSSPRPVTAGCWIDDDRVHPMRTLLEDARASKDGAVLSLLTLDWPDPEA